MDNESKNLGMTANERLTDTSPVISISNEKKPSALSLDMMNKYSYQYPGAKPFFGNVATSTICN